MTFTAVGSLTDSENAVSGTSTTFSLTTVTAGDFILVSLVNGDGGTLGVQTSNVTSTRCTWTKLAAAGPLDTNFYASIWLGQVLSAGADTVTVTYAATLNANSRFDAREFHSTASGVALDTYGTVNSSGGTADWATLTPAGPGELYWGWCEDTGSAIAGSTSGFVYEPDSHSNGSGYCLDVTSAYTPVWSDSSMAAGLMVLVKETGFVPAVTSLSSAALTSNTKPTVLTTASVSPSAGTAVLLWIGYQAASAVNISSVTGLGATWTHVLTVNGNPDCYLELWTCAPSSSGAITITGGAGFDSAAWDVQQATGVNSASPLLAANTVSGFTSGGSPVPVTFNQAAAAGNALVVAISWSVSNTGGWTQPTGFIQVTDVSGIGTFYSEMMTAQDGSPGSTTSFTFTASSSDKAPWIGVELAAGAGPAVISGADTGTSAESFPDTISLASARRWVS